jgi:hypothetical protein
MLIKSLMLYSLPYVAGIASSILAANQLDLGLKPSSFEPSAKSGVFQGQIVNRSLKGDRLPILHQTHRPNGKIYMKAPAQIAPKPEIRNGCWPQPASSVSVPPKDFDGRCFADWGVREYLIALSFGVQRTYRIEG